MFSPTIQGYINEGGKEAAMQRVQAITAHVASIENQLNPKPLQADKKTFAEVLKSSESGQGQFRTGSKNFLSLTSAAKKLEANTVNPTISKPLANAVSSVSNLINPTKTQILDMVSNILG